jgi:ABC-2 type transport system ATP-binding protein
VDNPILVEGLKSSGSVAAVKAMDFDVCAGGVFGLRVPTAQAKTTAIEILEGLRARSGGRVSVGEAIAHFSAFYTRTADTPAIS